MLHLNSLRCVHHRLIITAVVRLLDIDLCMAKCLEHNSHTPRRKQAVCLMTETIRPVALDLLSRILKDDITGEKENSALLLFFVNLIDIAFLHDKKTHIHHGSHVILGPVNVAVVSSNHFLAEVHEPSRIRDLYAL